MAEPCSKVRAHFSWHSDLQMSSFISPFPDLIYGICQVSGPQSALVPCYVKQQKRQTIPQVTTKLSMVTLISTAHTAQTNHANYIHSAFLAPQLLPSLVLICTHQSKHFCGWWPLLQFSKWLVLNAHFNITFLCCLPVTRCVPTTVLVLGTDADSVVLL